MLYHYFKRLFDFISSFTVISCQSGLCHSYGILVRIKLGKFHIFLSKKRTGRNGRHFPNDKNSGP